MPDSLLVVAFSAAPTGTWRPLLLQSSSGPGWGGPGRQAAPEGAWARLSGAMPPPWTWGLDQVSDVHPFPG